MQDSIEQVRVVRQLEQLNAMTLAATTLDVVGGS